MKRVLQLVIFSVLISDYETTEILNCLPKLRHENN